MGRYAKKFSLPSNHTSVIELLFFHDSNTVLSFDHNNTQFGLFGLLIMMLSELVANYHFLLVTHHQKINTESYKLAICRSYVESTTTIGRYKCFILFLGKFLILFGVLAI